MQLELKQIQSEVGITFIYVTHDQEEAITMSDRIAVMDNGIVSQVGTPRDIYEQPANRFVADFIGETNFVEAKVASSGTTTVLESSGVKIAGMARQSLSAGSSATLAIRPEKISLLPQSTEMDSNDANVVLDGTISEVIYIGTDTRYQVQIPTGDGLVVRVQNLGRPEDVVFESGESVKVHWLTENAQVLTE
ncbi:MAG: ABC transporter ATP-binding protein [Okeania sp. SIO4D6]|nr:ABC transporter ATP-binding protein [Okeania sp. SIO4D6]